MLTVDLERIPSELKTLPQWVVWRIEDRNGKPSKVPYDPTNPDRRAKADNPATWGTFEKAVSVANTRDFMGIGFEFSFYDPYCGIDLDKCRIAETGEIALWAREIITRVNSYTEISPSGQGVHILVKAKLPPGPRRKGKVEVYDVGRYFTMTGYHLKGTSTTIEDRQEELTGLHNEIFSQDKKEAPKASYPPLSVSLGDSDLIDKAHRASNGEKFGKLWRGDWSGYPSQSEATAALLNHLVFYSGPDPVKVDRLFRRSGLMRPKWDRPQVGSTWGALEIEKAINRATEFYTPSRQNATSTSPARRTERQQQTPERKEERAIPIFPQKVMTGAAGRFAEVYSRFLESAPAFLFMSYLTFLGHLISDRITLDAEIAPQPRLFTVLLGESSDARKSTAINKVFDFYYEAINSENLNTIHGVGSAEGLAKCFKKNKRTILIIDELKSIIQKMRIEGSILLPCINTLFESKRFHSLTKSHDITIDNAELCLLAASTLGTYYNMFHSTFIDIGFINRLFVVIGNSVRKYSIPITIPENEKKPLKEDLIEIMEFISLLKRDGCYKLPIDEEARTLFHQWYMSCESSLFSKRLDAYGHRLMVLLAANAKSERITPKIVEIVISLLNYEFEARRFADPVDADTLAGKLEERIRRVLANGPISKRELERRCNKARVGCAIWEHSVNNLRSSSEIIYDLKDKCFSLSSIASSHG